MHSAVSCRVSLNTAWGQEIQQRTPGPRTNLPGPGGRRLSLAQCPPPGSGQESQGPPPHPQHHVGAPSNPAEGLSGKISLDKSMSPTQSQPCGLRHTLFSLSLSHKHIFCIVFFFLNSLPAPPPALPLPLCINTHWPPPPFSPSFSHKFSPWDFLPRG